MAGRPNLLFLFSDQHTQKVTGCYGDKVVETPHIDRLAARGVTFDNAYTPSPLCTPARMALLTGRHPCRQECWTNSDVLRSDLPTHAHALGAAGYAPSLIGRLHAIGPDQLHGYAEREVGDHSTNWIGGIGHNLGALARTNDPFRDSLEKSGPGQSSYEVKDREVTEAACAHLERLGERRRRGDDSPFAVTVGYILPHQPYVASPDDYRRYEGRVGLPTIPAPEQEHPWLRAWRAHTGIADVPDEDTLRARTAFYGLVTAFDRMVGQVIETLERQGLAEDTLIVYASDHGDQIGERGLWWKQTFYDESVKVPLVLSWPGRLPEGERRGQVVNLIDLAATMVEAMGAPGLPNADARSLLGLAADGSLPWRDETFSEYCTDGMSPWAGTTPVQQRMIRTGRYKLIYYHDYPPQLFDLLDDPQETRDLAGDPRHGSIVRALTTRVLADWDPVAIARRMAERRAEKELLRAWAREVRPSESFHWQIRMEDNWLAVDDGSGGHP